MPAAAAGRPGGPAHPHDLRFEGARLQLTLTFMTPALPDDLDVLARPLTYLTWDVRSADGGSHAVASTSPAPPSWR